MNILASNEHTSLCQSKEDIAHAQESLRQDARMQGGHKPFSFVAIPFSPKHYWMCSRFCLVWTLLLCTWKTDGFAWLYVCVSLNLVTCVFI